jgi:hypothetical protein
MAEFERDSNYCYRSSVTIRRGLVIGRGGTLSFAWSAVALREIERALDWDVRGSDVLVGTSAGSEMVAAIGSGRAYVSEMQAGPARHRLQRQRLPQLLHRRQRPRQLQLAVVHQRVGSPGQPIRRS